MKKYKRFLGSVKMKDFRDRDRPGNKLRRYRRAIREGLQHKSFKGICVSNWWYRRWSVYNPLKMKWYVFQNARSVVKMKQAEKVLFGG